MARIPPNYNFYGTYKKLSQAKLVGKDLMQQGFLVRYDYNTIINEYVLYIKG